MVIMVLLVIDIGFLLLLVSIIIMSFSGYVIGLVTAVILVLKFLVLLLF